jgi:hypothetical protein
MIPLDAYVVIVSLLNNQQICCSVAFSFHLKIRCEDALLQSRSWQHSQ